MQKNELKGRMRSYKRKFGQKKSYCKTGSKLALPKFEQQARSFKVTRKNYKPKRASLSKYKNLNLPN